MKILYITLINKENALARNRHQLIHFIDKLGRLTDLYVYNRYGDMFQNATNIYDRYYCIKDIIEDIKPDLLLCYRIKRMLLENPVLNVPVIFIEQEYPLWNTKDIYAIIHKHNTKAVILTGYFPEAQSLLKIPVYWLPFSANEDMFFTEEVSHSERKKEIGFFGTASTAKMHGIHAYKIRRKAMHTLSANGLMSPKPHTPKAKKDKWLVNPEIYPSKLKQYVGCLSCAFNKLEQVPLKSFEIMASGTALLTQRYRWEITQALFGPDPSYFTYDNDMSDIVSVAKMIIEDQNYTESVCRDALKLMNERHLHKHRVLELYEILQAVLEERIHESQQFSYI